MELETDRAPYKRRSDLIVRHVGLPGKALELVLRCDGCGAVILETCLADKLAFVERTKRLIRNVVEIRVAERAGA